MAAMMEMMMPATMRLMTRVLVRVEVRLMWKVMMTERDDTRESEADNESDGKLHKGDSWATFDSTNVLQEAQVLFAEILIEFFSYRQVRLNIFISEYFLFFLSLSSNFFASIHMKVWRSGGSYILLIMMSMDEDISRAKLARAQRNPENIVSLIFSYIY